MYIIPFHFSITSTPSVYHDINIFFKLSEISRPKFDCRDISVKNKDNNPSLVLKEDSPPCVDFTFCCDVPSEQNNEAGSACYACPTATQGKY